MQDIGLSQAEVKKTIRTQVLLVFFLPLGAAGLHMAMAFKVLVKMMALFSAYNIKLFQPVYRSYGSRFCSGLFPCLYRHCKDLL
ncbi:MAG: hypothetical protein ACLR2E_15465 [Lachnospiraceae bacterium]